ncbi:MAG TPA: SDR family NAD(P)-dependent oxidoreductase [Acidisphaera sp.]|nr:SDR family NAD(P)-dependent oxidoreductase [Acidisphaera sp.]
MDRLAGRIAVVFGGGSVGPGWGNGKAAALQYARSGATVAVVDIALAAAEETAALIAGEQGTALAFRCDVTQPEGIEAVIAAVEREHGRVDILHNNVGAPDMGTIEDITVEQWTRTQDINLKSVFLTCKRVIPMMRRQRKGAIINISSVAAIRHTGYPYPGYYASKAGVNQLTVALAVQYARDGIRVNAIMPGLIDTPHIYKAIVGQYDGARERMVAERSAMCPMGRMGTGWDIAKAAVFLASDDAEYITGVCLPVDGGLTCRV